MDFPVPDLRQDLDSLPWGDLTINGIVLGQWCPRCNALVAPGVGSNGKTGREQHTAWHEANGT